jgi:hypothetical protein
MRVCFWLLKEALPAATVYLDKLTGIDIILHVYQLPKQGIPDQGLFAQGKEGPVKLEQISIFLENKSGRLAEVTEILARNGINIRALSLADTADFGILRLIVNDLVKTKAVLKEQGFTVATNEVVAVVLPDRPGGLASILALLQGKTINVEYMYAFVQKSEGNAVLIFRFDEIQQAIDALRKAGIRVLSSEEVQQW